MTMFGFRNEFAKYFRKGSNSGVIPAKVPVPRINNSFPFKQKESVFCQAHQDTTLQHPIALCLMFHKITEKK